MATRSAVFPRHPHALYRQHGYSPAVRSGELLFVSGMVGARPDGTPEPDLDAQVRLAFDSLRGVLEAAGCGFDDVLDVTLFMVDPDASFAPMVAALHAAFPAEPQPSVTAIGVNWLAGFQVEVKVVARIPS